MENYRTFDSVTAFLNQSMANKEVLDANLWLTAAQSLILFLEAEQEKLFHLQQEVAKIKLLSMEAGESGMKARVRVEASPDYLDMLKQKARVDRGLEIIRISKIQARLSNDILHSH